MTYEEYVDLPSRDKIRYTSLNRAAIKNWCSFTDKKLSSKMRVYLFLNKKTDLPLCKICQKTQLTTSLLTCSSECNIVYTGHKKKEIGKDGLTSAQRGGMKLSQKLSEIGDDGLTGAQRSGIKTSRTVTEVGDDGLTIAQRRVAKSTLAKSVVGLDGLTVTERGTLRSVSSMKKNRSRILQSNLERSREKYGAKLNQEYFSKYTTVELSRKLGISYTGVQGLSDRFDLHPKKSGPVSHVEIEIAEYLQSMGIFANLHDRTILDKKELDLYIPLNNLAIEFDGMYWHGFKQVRKHNPDLSISSISKIHLNKTLGCEEKGVTLFHIFESEWNDPTKNLIWKSMIRSAVGKSERIYARKCAIAEIDSKAATDFLNNNHLQGSINSKFRLALFYNDEIVAIATFGASRYSRQYDYELLRMCNKRGTTVVGGFSRLLTAFRRSNPGSLISYANRRFSTGNVYEKNGFTLRKSSDPCYWYFNSSSGLVHRSTFMKHRLSNLLDEFDPSLTEWENMSANGWDKIYDCGNLIYSLEQ